MTSTASVPPQIEKPAFGKFFLPGPTDVHPDVLEAMIHPMIGHRSSAMEKLLQGMAPRLSALARTADRKSTRLNSSHTVISYAVFCLKKKKKKRLRRYFHRSPLRMDCQKSFGMF